MEVRVILKSPMGLRRDPRADHLIARLDAEGKAPAPKCDALRSYFAQKAW